MKRKVVMSFMLVCMLALFTGCGSTETKEADATVAETEEDSDGKGSRAEAADEESAENKASVAPVLGGENIEGYKDFAYLYEEFLITKTDMNRETGQRERKTLTVYVPDDEDTTADGNYAHAESMGVNFRVELEPYLRPDAEDYLPEENLDEYVASKYDPFYYEDYKDVIINPAQEAGAGVVSTVEYCKYDDWEEVYYSVFCTYYLAELEGGETVLVSVEITNNEVTGKAEDLLDELEQFYQFDIYWDVEKANQKSADCAENGTANTYSTSNLLFELPQGWEEDDDLSSYDMSVYAPEGDFLYSGCMIAVTEDYLDSVDYDVQMFADESGQEFIKEILGEVLTDYDAQICDTAFGEAAKITFNFKEDDTEVDGVLYVVIKKLRMYRFISYDMPDAVENAAMVLDGIMSTGQLRD